MIEHDYLSTACLHGRHDACGRLQRNRGDLSPPHCKYCDAPCYCPCHKVDLDEPQRHD